MSSVQNTNMQDVKSKIVSLDDENQFSISISDDQKTCWIKRLPDNKTTTLKLCNTELDAYNVITLAQIYPMHGIQIYREITEFITLKNKGE